MFTNLFYSRAYKNDKAEREKVALTLFHKKSSNISLDIKFKTPLISFLAFSYTIKFSILFT